MATVAGIKALGQLIRGARLAKEWTQKDVAGRSGLSIGYISNVEKGYVNPARGPVVPSDDALRGLSEALDIPVNRMHGALGRVEGESEHEPFLEEIRQAGYLEHLSPSTQAEILEYIRFRSEQERAKTVK